MTLAGASPLQEQAVGVGQKDGEEVRHVTGRIFNIQRFSIHDGPGIRTTVFLKGCTLRCAWCHNPESIAIVPELAFFPNKCIRCGHCFQVCPTGALRLEGDQRRHDKALCQVCGKCADACYAEAIVMEGRDATAEEVVAEVLKDKPFYDNSGGGVTLSGGEPLLQAEFAAEVLARCKAAGVHTALDTAASVPWAAFESTLPHTDLVLLDLKLMDPARHRAATGAANDLILANARRLAEGATPLIVRVPIIPGHTDDMANLAAIADFVRGFARLDYIELLPYHRFAEAKYRRLERGYALEGVEPPREERLDALAAVAAARGLRVKVAAGARK
jgi:pyruvate formate lyase activating enzyme